MGGNQTKVDISTYRDKSPPHIGQITDYILPRAAGSVPVTKSKF